MQAIGIVELNSIAKGVEVLDAMLKAAKVEALVSSPVCPGKYIIVVGGEVAPCRASVEEGIAKGKECITDHQVIPNVHDQVFPAIMGTTEVEKVQALGIIETFALPACIVASDSAVKAANVTLIEIRLAKALGGKAFVVLTGEVAAVRAAVQAGTREIKDTGTLLGDTIIPAPHKDLLKTLL